MWCWLYVCICVYAWWLSCVCFSSPCRNVNGIFKRTRKLLKFDLYYTILQYYIYRQQFDSWYAFDVLQQQQMDANFNFIPWIHLITKTHFFTHSPTLYSFIRKNYHKQTYSHVSGNHVTVIIGYCLANQFLSHQSIPLSHLHHLFLLFPPISNFIPYHHHTYICINHYFTYCFIACIYIDYTYIHHLSQVYSTITITHFYAIKCCLFRDVKVTSKLRYDA